MASSVGSSAFESWVFPGVNTNANGHPFPSVTRWIFVVMPPRLRPSASPGMGANPPFRREDSRGAERRLRADGRGHMSHPPRSRPRRSDRWRGHGQATAARCASTALPVAIGQTGTTPSAMVHSTPTDRAKGSRCGAPTTHRSPRSGGNATVSRDRWRSASMAQSMPTGRRSNHLVTRGFLLSIGNHTQRQVNTEHRLSDRP